MNVKRRISSSRFLIISIGLVYVWFGALKFFPGVSHAEKLAQNTMDVLTLGLISPNVSIILLALSETIIGVLLILNIYRHVVIRIALVHMIFTFVPLFLFPEQSFSDSPLVFTLLGQYIFKNIIIIGALLTLYKLPKSIRV
ncbi:doxx family protein [Aquimarina sp. 2201CG5-10]|uniref:doxx family protein n=1 Tax=Aquimarina callyspongiae TaxID=3098150 RepID=UPI002AB4F934|nr:doxx family protein [Aquimarina sp. 2201CG5-10]MDY8134924.1 doxx family protein [Aquimarina sp. 2201CG5-10]